MRFKKFLTEADPIEEIISLFKGDYSDAYKMGFGLYRGIQDEMSRVYEIRTSAKFKRPRGERGSKFMNKEKHELWTTDDCLLVGQEAFGVAKRKIQRDEN